MMHAPLGSNCRTHHYYLKFISPGHLENRATPSCPPKVQHGVRLGGRRPLRLVAACAHGSLASSSSKNAMKLVFIALLSTSVAIKNYKQKDAI
jgi:hypothetical protein